MDGKIERKRGKTGVKRREKQAQRVQSRAEQCSAVLLEEEHVCMYVLYCTVLASSKLMDAGSGRVE